MAMYRFAMRRCERCGSWDDGAVKALGRAIAAYERARRTTNGDELARERRAFESALDELRVEQEELVAAMANLFPSERAEPTPPRPVEWRPPRVDSAPPPPEFRALARTLG